MNECEYVALVEWYWRENRSTPRKTCPSATLSTTNPILIGLESNLDLCGGKLVTNPLNYKRFFAFGGREFCFGSWNGNVSIGSVSVFHHLS